MRLSLSLLCGLLICWAGPANATPSSGTNLGALPAALANQFKSRSVILLGEQHQNTSYHLMLESLLRDPVFVCNVDDVMLESGNSLYQDIADRFTSGKDVTRADKVKIWRNTTQWLVWDSPVYEAILDTVREVNESGMCAHPVRVLLGEPPIDWDKVQTAQDYEQFADRDQSYLDILEKEVISRDRKALFIVGRTHTQKAAATEIIETSNMVGTMLDQKFPLAAMSVWTVSDPESAAKWALRQNVLRLISGTDVGSQSFGSFFGNTFGQITVNGEKVWKPMSELDWPPAQEVIDALLYVGDNDSTIGADPAIYQDPDYQVELRRRAAILEEVYGFEFLPDLEELLAQQLK